jgi:divinyl protochlorophyllide a 8-vinyl-reductase
MAAHLASRSGRIGPNAITRVAEVLRARVGTGATSTLFEHAGLSGYLLQPPQSMVDEAEVRRLHGVLREDLGDEQARAVARDAGLRTAEYLLAHRIPRPVQRLLKFLPAALAARVLLAAISRNAWTFAGSGKFSARVGQPVVLTLRNNPYGPPRSSARRYAGRSWMRAASPSAAGGAHPARRCAAAASSGKLIMDVGGAEVGAGEPGRAAELGLHEVELALQVGRSRSCRAPCRRWPLRDRLARRTASAPAHLVEHQLHQQRRHGRALRRSAASSV